MFVIGIPVPIVAISAGVAHNQYGHDDLWVILLFSCINILSLYKAVGLTLTEEPYGDL